MSEQRIRELMAELERLQRLVLEGKIAEAKMEDIQHQLRQAIEEGEGGDEK